MKILIGLFLLVFGKAYGNPVCDYHFQIANPVIEVLSTSQVVQQNIFVNRGQNSPSGRCGLYRVFFSKGLSNSYQRRAFTIFGQSVTYNLHRTINQAGILKDINDAVTANEFVSGSAPSKFTTYNNNFFVSVPGLANQMIRSGTYFDIIQVTIFGYNENSGKYNFEESSPMTVVLYIPKNIQVSIIDEGGNFDGSSTTKVMDFGVISKNQEKGVDVRVISNGSYQIKLSSQNNGFLKHTSQETISYALRVNNSTVSLAGSSGSPVTIGQGDATPTAGDRFNLKVRILEETNNKSAGLYQDSITITAIAN